MDICKFSTIEHLLCRHVSQALSKVGIQLDPEALTSYCEHLFSRTGQTYFTLRHENPPGVIEFHELVWDSEIYGLPIGAFGALVLDSALIPEKQCRWSKELAKGATKYAFAQQVDMLVCRVQLSDLLWIQTLEDVGFRTMDVQCSLVLKNLSKSYVEEIIYPSGVNIRDFTPEDFTQMVSFGKSAFGRSHLYADICLPKDKSDELHEAWLKNDCNGRAEFVLVAEVCDRVCGFLAGLWDNAQDKLLGLKHGHIDLIAVTESKRGRGIGSLLTKAALHRFQECGANFVTVSTQATNQDSIILYQRCGFNISGFDATFHAWRRE